MNQLSSFAEYKVGHRSMLHCTILVRFPSFGRALMLVYVRPSNEITDDPSQLAHFLFRGWG